VTLTPEPGIQRASEETRNESMGQLFSELTSDVSTLFRQEVALAKAEISVKAKEAGKGAGLLGGASVTGLITLGSLTAFLIALLSEWMDVWLAALIVTIVWAIVTAVLAQVGRSRLKEAAPPVPQQAIDSTKEDVQWAKTQLKSEKR
jgi:type IV secretory pathway TrbD component